MSSIKDVPTDLLNAAFEAGLRAMGPDGKPPSEIPKEIISLALMQCGVPVTEESIQAYQQLAKQNPLVSTPHGREGGTQMLVETMERLANRTDLAAADRAHFAAASKAASANKAIGQPVSFQAPGSSSKEAFLREFFNTVKERDDESSAQTCAHGPCAKPEVNLRCTGCKVVWYCSRDHQKADWKKHKKVCKDYNFLRERGYMKPPAWRRFEQELDRSNASQTAGTTSQAAGAATPTTASTPQSLDMGDDKKS
jgi:hypothetical protein